MSRDPFDRVAQRPQATPLTRRAVTWIVLAIALAGVAGLYFWDQKPEQQAPMDQPQKAEAPPQPPPPPSSEPEVSHPLREPQPLPGAKAKPLPPLSESDETIRESLAGPMPEDAVGDLVISKDLARRIVSTVDNLPRQKVAARLLPVKPPAGQIITSGEGDLVTLSPANYARYASYVKLVRGVDAKRLVAVYVHFYPLFQQAYEELGYPKRYFNDRLVDVIDDLLAAPDVPEPVKLVRPKVLYEFADPELEDLPAGQKILIRIGPQNAAVIKSKLREIRLEVATEGPSAQR